MDLLTKTKFALWAGKSGAAVSNALKKGRLEVFQDTNKINTGSAKSQKFKGTIGNGQKNIIPAVTSEVMQPGEKSETLEKAGEKVLLATAQKTIEGAKREKQQRIKLELDNAFTMGELIAIESINKSMMMYLDLWLNTNKRRFNANFPDLKRLFFKLFENETRANEKDFQLHDISDSKIKRDQSNLFEDWSHEAKTELVKKLREIQKDQSRK